MSHLGRCGRKRKKRKKITTASHSHLEVFIELKQWMKISEQPRSSAFCLSILEPAFFDETGRGLRTRQCLRPGDTIVSIPGQCLVTVETVFSSPLGRYIVKSGVKWTSQQLLTLYLLCERAKGKQSSWAPYISSLPLAYTNALYLLPSELHLLKSSARELADAALQRFEIAFEKISQFLDKHWTYLFPASLCSAPPIPGRLDVKWAWSTLNTRSVFLETPSHPLVLCDPEESNMALAPFLDLLNHTDKAQITAGLNEVTNTYDIVTHDRYDKFDQVFICYGCHDNSKLAVEYGFAVPGNLNNTVSFTLDDVVSVSRAHIKTKGEFERKRKILQDSKLSKKLLCSMDGCSWSLMAALTIFCLPWDLLDKWKGVLQGHEVSKVSAESAQLTAKSLLTSSLHTARVLQQKLTSQGDPLSPHFHMISQLAEDDVQILQTSLDILDIDSGN